MLAGGLGLLLLAAAGLAVLAIRQTSRAEEQGRVALSRALAGQADAQLGRRLDQALLLALEAYRNERTPEARSALLAAVQRTRGFEAIMGGQHELATSVAVSADGKTIASGGADGEVVIWSVARRRPVAPAVRVGSAVRQSRLQPGGRASWPWGPRRRRSPWSTSQAARTEGSLEGHDGPVTSLVFDSRERLRSASGFDGSVRLWDVARRRPAAEPVRLAWEHDRARRTGTRRRRRSPPRCRAGGFSWRTRGAAGCWRSRGTARPTSRPSPSALTDGPSRPATAPDG